MRTRDAAILIVPGLGNSGPDHWQTRWEAKLTSARRVEQDSWTHPQKQDWVANIRAAIGAATQPVVVIAHSLGAVAFAHAVSDHVGGKLAGAFLVTPPSEDSLIALGEVDPAFTPIPSGPLPCPSVTVGSRNDPYASIGTVEGLALDWGSRFIDAGEAGHLNEASGHGPWPEGLMAFAGFLNKL